MLTTGVSGAFLSSTVAAIIITYLSLSYLYWTKLIYPKLGSLNLT